jgi:hypothetical protein
LRRGSSAEAYSLIRRSENKKIKSGKQSFEAVEV